MQHITLISSDRITKFLILPGDRIIPSLLVLPSIIPLFRGLLSHEKFIIHSLYQLQTTSDNETAFSCQNTVHLKNTVKYFL